MNQLNKQQESVLSPATAEDQAAGIAATNLTPTPGNSSSELTNNSRVGTMDASTPEVDIFRTVLEELTPRANEKINREAHAIKAFRRRLATLLKQGVTPEALYNAAVAKGFKIGRDEFNKIVRSITHPRPRISRAKPA